MMADATTSAPAVPWQSTGIMARCVTVLLALLFLVIIVGHVMHTRQFWLLAVFIGLFLLSRRSMKRPFFVLAFALPFLQGLGVSRETYMIAPVLEVSLLAFFVLWFIQAARGKALLLRTGPLDASLLLFLAVACGSALLTVAVRVWTAGVPLSGLVPDALVFRTPPLSPLFPVREFFIFLEAFLLFGFVRANLDRDDVETLALTLLSAAVLVLLIGAAILLKVDQRQFFRGVNRATSVFSGPNQFATYLLLLLPMAAAVARTARTWRARGLALVVGVGGVLMLFFSRSQGAWLAAFAAPVAYVLVSPQDKPRLVWAGRVLAAVAILGAVFGGGFLLMTRAPEQLNDLLDGRYFLWRAGIDMVRESPLMGVGLGNFYPNLGAFYPDGITGREQHEHAHNMYLQFLAELGLVGLVAFVFPFGKLLSRAARAPLMPVMTRAMLVAVLGVLLHSFFDYTLWIASISLLFWMHAGVLAVLLDAQTAPQREEADVPAIPPAALGAPGAF